MLGRASAGLGMGWLAERIGVQCVVTFGALMVCAGLALSSGGEVWQLYVGHGLLIGLIGNGGINAPLYVYVTRWFERRRGTALALLSSGQYVAGASLAAAVRARHRSLRLAPDDVRLRPHRGDVVVPLAILFLRPAPEPPEPAMRTQPSGTSGKVLGLPSNLAFGLLAGAAVPVLRADGHAGLAFDRPVRRSGSAAGARRRDVDRCSCRAPFLAANSGAGSPTASAD